MGNTDRKEDGFTKIPHRIYDAVLAQKLSASQEKAVLYIIRKTYGFHKSEDAISISKMASDTGFTRKTMVNAIHDLEKMGIVRLGEIVSGRPTHMMLNDPSKWDRNL